MIHKNKVENLNIGPNVSIGENVTIVGGPGSSLTVGEYTKIHKNSIIIARGSVTIGEACWFGERTVIDGTGELVVGDFVGVGIGSALYSHIEHGDVLEGSKYRSRGKLLIGDDAWIVGQCLVSPVTVGEKSMAMLGSVVVKDMLPRHVYGGNPAKDITEKVKAPWEDVDVVSKYKYLKTWMDAGGWDRCLVVYEWPDKIDEKMSYYNVTTREYYAGSLTKHWHSRMHWSLLGDTIRFRKRRVYDDTIV